MLLHSDSAGRDKPPDPWKHLHLPEVHPLYSIEGVQGPQEVFVGEFLMVEQEAEFVQMGHFELALFWEI